MNIDGHNTLACLTPISSLKAGASRITPLPHLPVLKDLIPDLTGLYAQYALIEPWLQSDQAPPDRERRQSPEDRAKLDGLWECILCFCCSTSCPSYWWNQDKYLGPSILLQSYRWLADSRDQSTGERLDRLRPARRLRAAMRFHRRWQIFFTTRMASASARARAATCIRKNWPRSALPCI